MQSFDYLKEQKHTFTDFILTQARQTHAFERVPQCFTSRLFKHDVLSFIALIEVIDQLGDALDFPTQVNDELLAYRQLEEKAAYGAKDDLNFVNSARSAMFHSFATPLII